MIVSNPIGDNVNVIYKLQRNPISKPIVIDGFLKRAKIKRNNKKKNRCSGNYEIDNERPFRLEPRRKSRQFKLQNENLSMSILI